MIRKSEQLLKKSLEIKARQRHAIADLTFEEKYEILRSIQKRSAEMLAPHGITRRIWPPIENAITHTSHIHPIPEKRTTH